MAATYVSVVLLLSVLGSASAQLSTGFYSSSCPNLLSTVKPVVHSAIYSEQRMGASLLRLFFHDCFVNVRRQACSVANHSAALLCRKLMQRF